MRSASWPAQWDGQSLAGGAAVLPRGAGCRRICPFAIQLVTEAKFLDDRRETPSPDF